jgi:Protein of unknown function (DUF4232)
MRLVRAAGCFASDPEEVPMRRLVFTLLMLAGAAMVAACGSSTSTSTANEAAGSPTQSVTTVTKTTTASSSATTTTAPSSATTTTQSTAAAGQSPCRAAGLALTFLGGQGATGHGLLGFALRNTTDTTCSTIGYPGIQFLDRSGGHLETTPIHTTHDFFGPAPLRALIVAPGHTVSFRLGVTHGSGSTSGCTTAYGLRVIAPNDTDTLSVSMADGAYECRTATVSPLQPGTSAYR